MIVILMTLLFSITIGALVGWEHRPWDKEDKGILLAGIIKMFTHALILMAVIHYILANLP